MVDWSKVLKILEGTSYLIVILGVPLFFIQLYMQNERDKREESLRIVSKFQSEAMLSAREVSQRPWRKISLPTLINEGLDKKGFDKLVLKIVGSDNELQKGISAILDFYISAELCVDLDICENKTLNNYIGGYAREFNCIYGGYIQSLRSSSGIASLGSGLTAYSKDRSDCFGKT